MFRILKSWSRSLSRTGIFAVIGFLILFCSACGETVSPSIPYSLNDVAPIFRESYKYWGGYDRLGPIISDAIQDGVKTIQFTHAVAMVFDPSAPAEQRFDLAALGRQLEVNEKPLDEIASSGPLFFIPGHYLSEIEKMGGFRFTGMPLGEERYNSAQRRYEQYFEKVGFYRNEGEEEIHLLAYGAALCKHNCRSSDPGDATIEGYRIDPVFRGFVNQWGIDLTGLAISEGYVGRDGKWEQIFENIVLTASSQNDPGSVGLRPVPRDLNIIPEIPQPYSGITGMLFYAVQGDHGYEIPIVFWRYVAEHGGTAVFGDPITHPVQPVNAGFYQCFMYLCLTYTPDGSQQVQVRPEPLGIRYKDLFYRISTPSGIGFQNEGSPSIGNSDMAIWTWEAHPTISSLQQQEIGVRVLSNKFPNVNIVPELTLTMPDASQHFFTMAVTDADGKSSIVLPPIMAQNGSLIAYQVCVPSPNDTVCVSESFIIWSNP